MNNLFNSLSCLTSYTAKYCLNCGVTCRVTVTNAGATVNSEPLCDEYEVKQKV